jgi:putative methyltransferase (TIGR04325 family)
MVELKSLARGWLPPAMAAWARRLRRGQNRFVGDFATWGEAAAQSTGYDAEAVFQRVYDAALRVKRGEAVFERDSVCFYHEEYRWEALACLLLAAAKSGGELGVLDFGGSLGSFYFQHRPLLGRLKALRWGIVEQQRYVECGRREFEDGSLKFHESIGECVQNMRPNVILLSSVLQYLEKPHDILAELASHDVSYIVVDRTPFRDGEKDSLLIQQVAKSIYPASYPMWAFSTPRFEQAMRASGYRRMADWPSPEGQVGNLRFQGALYGMERQ